MAREVAEGSAYVRIDRGPNEIRSVRMTTGVMKYAEGSCLIEMGDTRVICTATLDERVPPFLKGTGQGWVTAEYSMLPRSTPERTQRESVRGRPSGRTSEIQRLVGRALRAVVDLRALRERTLIIDCDVLQADGGTRTASITGGFVALVQAAAKLRESGAIEVFPIKDYLAAVSVGKVEGEMLLDLSYEEDSRAEVDINVVMTGSGKFVEVQGTAERSPFSLDELQGFLELARTGIRQLMRRQREALGDTARLLSSI